MSEPVSTARANRSLFDELMILFEHGDVCALLFGGLIMLFVGQKAVNSRPDAQRWGLRLGVLAFMTWYVRDVLQHGLWGAEQLAATGVRALLVMLYFTSVAWLLLAVGNCASGEVLDSLFASVRTFFCRLIGPVKKRFTVRSFQRPVFPDSPETCERRTQAAQEAADRERLLREQQQARESVRYDLELFYDRHRAELADALPPERFEEYFNRYLTDQLDPDAYSQRAGELKDMIRESAGVNPKNRLPEFESIEQIVEYFRAKIQRLQLLDLDEDTLETLEVTLEEIQDREIRRLLG